MTEPAGTFVPMFPEPEQPDEQSWDAFWAEVKGTATTTVRGIVVRTPTGLTLGAQHQLEQMADVGGVEGFAPMALELFRAPDGSMIPDLWERWRAAGMELDELQTLTLWGIAHAKGNPITFAEAREQAQKAVERGKAPARTSSSAGTGGPSRRGSAPTASRRKPSPA